MKNKVLILIIFIFASCSKGRIDNAESIKNDYSTQEDTLRNKNHYYYLSDLPLRQVGDLIISDSIAPSDNFVTFELMDSLNSDNKEARDFYFHVFEKIVKKSDGALSEVVGAYAQQYIENYPAEFFQRYNCCDSSSQCCDGLIKIANYVTYEIGMQQDIEDSFETFMSKVEKGYVDYPMEHKLIIFTDTIANGLKEYMN
jgi:hypothetical protein